MGIFSSASPWQHFYTVGAALQEVIQDEEPDLNALVNQNKSEITLHPNPSSGNVNVRSSKAFQQLTITDLTGRIVWEQTRLEVQDLEININELAPGLYYLHAQWGLKVMYCHW